jgi:predicted TIM-barrel fold metal-dependent hydrolase
VTKTAYRIFDADLHHHYPSWAAILPYLPEQIPAPYFGGNPMAGPTGFFREDTTPPRGGLPASDPDFVIEQHLDRYDIEYAILNCGSTLGLGVLPDAEVGALIAHATNDWTASEWLSRDPRFLGAIVIEPNDPTKAAEEIRRSSSNPQMVQVTMTSAPFALGNRFLHPIYEACSEVGLPLNFHPPGVFGINTTRYSVGEPSSFAEFRMVMALAGIQHLVSLVFEGVFVRFPKFRFVLNEFGVAWLPFVMWRMDMEYRAAREEVPWLTQLPSQYLRDFVRFTTQPIEEGQKPSDIVNLLSLIDAHKLLLYSSDYPHHDFDSPEVAMRQFSDEWKRDVFFDNASQWYRLEERLSRSKGMTHAPVANARGIEELDEA